jgi:hypothetical protein
MKFRIYFEFIMSLRILLDLNFCCATRSDGSVDHEWERTSAHAVAWCRAWLTRPVIYDRSIRGHVQDPLEWFSSDTPALPC